MTLRRTLVLAFLAVVGTASTASAASSPVTWKPWLLSSPSRAGTSAIFPDHRNRRLSQHRL